MLNDLKNNALLLTVLLFLVVIKFIIVPVIDWQGELIAESESYQSRINKVSDLNSNRDNLQSSLLKLVEQEKIAKSLIHQNTAEAPFKLKLQKQLDGYATKYNVKVSNVNWLTTVPMSESAMTIYPISMKVRGPTSQVVQFVNYLESLSPIWDVEGFNLNIKRQKAKTLGSIEGQLNVNLYMEAKN